MSDDFSEFRKKLEEMQKQIKRHGEDIEKLLQQSTWDRESYRERKNESAGRNP